MANIIEITDFNAKELDIYARLRLNDKYDAVSVLTFTLIQNEWRISDERIVATQFEEF